MIDDVVFALTMGLVALVDPAVWSAGIIGYFCRRAWLAVVSGVICGVAFVYVSVFIGASPRFFFMFLAKIIVSILLSIALFFIKKSIIIVRFKAVQENSTIGGPAKYNLSAPVVLMLCFVMVIFNQMNRSVVKYEHVASKNVIDYLGYTAEHAACIDKELDDFYDILSKRIYVNRAELEKKYYTQYVYATENYTEYKPYSYLPQGFHWGMLVNDFKDILTEDISRPSHERVKKCQSEVDRKIHLRGAQAVSGWNAYIYLACLLLVAVRFWIEPSLARDYIP
jgi:uncharacterized membrane protein (UPF0136 family)